MKKLFMLFVTLTALTLTVSAQKSFNSQQRALRDNIKTYVQNEGYAPSIDSDGDIKFKKEGHTYYVIISEVDTNPMHVAVARYFDYDEDATKSRLTQYATEINKWKMCKIVLMDDYFTIRSDMYLTDYKAFTAIFNKMVNQVNNACNELGDMF